MTEKFIFYVNSDILNPKNFTDDKIRGFTKAVNPILDIGRKLKARIYYSDDDFKTLVEYFDEPSFNEDFSKSQANRLDELLKDFRKNKEINNFFKVHFSGEETSLESLKIPFVNPDEKEKIHIIFNLAENLSKQSIPFVKSNEEFERMEINYFCKADEIWKFINSHLPKRKYNFSPKHGDNTRLVIPPNNKTASQLLCSDEEALSLLESAIFDLRENNWCYNFDNSHQTYIVFPYEGNNPQNGFHAYHIDKGKWRKEIPDSILKHFGKW